jgi:glycosyltransferase involved in cell wall biosynthesis
MVLSILWNSDRMLGGSSAYSKIARETCTRLAREGYRVAHLPMGSANRMGTNVHEGVVILQSGLDPFNEDVTVDRYLSFKADLLIVNKETWLLQDIPKWGVNFCPMVPIDHSPVSGFITSKLGYAFKVIAISRFGQQELQKQGIKSNYIPNGVRTDIYKAMNKEMCKKAFYFEPDDFVIGIVARNQSRKMIPRQLRGYKRFLKMNPDIKCHLMLWTNVRPSSRPEDTPRGGVADVGVNLLPEIYELGLGNAPNDVRWTKWEEVEKMGGLPEYDPSGAWDMVKLYNSFDVLLGCTGGEGAGLPYLEAASCGVTSVYTNYAAASEYAGPVGIPVEADDYVIINTPGTRYALASIDGMAEALTKVYNADREKLAKRARLHAEKYDWEKVVQNYWVPFLESCKSELYPRINKDGAGTWA